MLYQMRIVYGSRGSVGESEQDGSPSRMGGICSPPRSYDAQLSASESNSDIKQDSSTESCVKAHASVTSCAKACPSTGGLESEASIADARMHPLPTPNDKLLTPEVTSSRESASAAVSKWASGCMRVQLFHSRLRNSFRRMVATRIEAVNTPRRASEVADACHAGSFTSVEQDQRRKLTTRSIDKIDDTAQLPAPVSPARACRRFAGCLSLSDTKFC